MLVLGIFSLGYYIAISLAMWRWDSTFARFWLFTGISFVSLYIIMQKLPESVNLLIYIGFFVLLAVFLFVQVKIFCGMIPSKTAKCSWLIVLGAQINGTRITDSLRRRLDKAAVYLHSHPDTTVIVSGGRGKGEDLTEAEAMASYLVCQGIDPHRIIQEKRSTTTKENLQFSAAYISDSNANVGIVTNNFHMYRAKQYGRRLSYRNVYGIPASTSPVLFFNYATREFFAVWKMWIFTNNDERS